MLTTRWLTGQARALPGSGARQPALASLIIAVFRLQEVTKITEETRRKRPELPSLLPLLALRPG